MIDVVSQVNAVQRRVGDRVLEEGEARTVTLTRTYAAPVEAVWDACTNPERIPRWFLPVSGNLQPGGRYRLEGNAEGTVQRCQPPRSFAATWEFAGNVSWIEVRLSPHAEGQTLLELEHIALVADDDRWAQFGPGAVGIGWELALAGLDRHLSSGRSVDPQEGREWSVSEEGRQFMSLSSERWRDAAIAAGDDERMARAAAERTMAAYTGTEPVSSS